MGFEDQGHVAVRFNIRDCGDGPVMDSWQPSQSHIDIVQYVLLYIGIEYTQSPFSRSMSRRVTAGGCRFVVMLYSVLFSVVTKILLCF